MKQKIIWLILILIIIGLVFLIVPKNQKKQIEIKINNTKLYAEIAKTEFEKTRGLMYRKSLKENEGMLFIFQDTSYHNFWMKNTLIPLDIIWINENKKVVDIKHSVPTCTDTPCMAIAPAEKALYVIETNGGWAEKNNIKIGDEVFFTLPQ